jgi:hypothetical protein
MSGYVNCVYKLPVVFGFTISLYERTEIRQIRIPLPFQRYKLRV